MISLARLSLVVSVSYTLFVVDVRMDAHVERFVVVSRPPDVEDLYFKLRSESQKTSLLIESQIDDDSIRKQICDDITDSRFFRRYRLHAHKKFGSHFFRRPFHFHYDTFYVKLSHYSSSNLPKVTDFVEYVFVCLVRQGWNKKHYYISYAFNLNFESSSPSLPGRFIFCHHSPRTAYGMVYGLAELPGRAFYSPDYNVENLYLWRRENLAGFAGVTTRAWSSLRDPLCKLANDEKERICLAVLQSKYFAEKVKPSFFCLVRNVSFQTEQEEAASKFEEWLLNCYSDYGDFGGYFYSLSQAYTSNQIFVYVVDKNTGDAFLDHLVTNVRLTWLPPNLTAENDTDTSTDLQ